MSAHNISCSFFFFISATKVKSGVSMHVYMYMYNNFPSCVQFKVWVKPGAEQSFLYGNHVLKSGLGRITENTMQYQGVVVYSMADVPLVSLCNHDGVLHVVPAEATQCGLQCCFFQHFHS